MHPSEFQVTGRLVDLEARRIFPARVTVCGGVIAAVEEVTVGELPADAGYLLPGFVDAHIHVESSMLPPAEFARAAVAHGTVAAVADPHEIANVLGVPGVEFMLASAAQSPFKFSFGVPSCVPATTFETSGAALDAAAVAALLDRPDLGFLSEVMNWPGVIARDPEVMAKIAAAQARGKRVDGHAPGVTGEALRAYVSAGIETDHESMSLAEGREKIGLGVRVIIREGSAARNFDALHPLLKESPERVMLCSDDKHPDDLVRGHINALVARAIALGYDLFDVLRAASTNPVRHYGLPVGQLKVGDAADFIVVPDLVAFRPAAVYLDGILVAKDGQSLLASVGTATPNHFSAAPLAPADLRVPAGAGVLRVIGVDDGQLVTREERHAPTVVAGAVVSDTNRDILKIAVLNRYDTGAKPTVGFIRGFGLTRGAIASTVAHDSHNLIAVGATDEDLAAALNWLIAERGGVVAVGDGRHELLPLPIAGLMSDLPAEEVAARYTQVDALAKQLGSPLRAPFMTLSFMALLVIPELKISDRCLFDGRAFAPVDVFAG